MADPPFAVLRADADPNIGMGHLMRTLALGEGLVELGWRVALAFNAPPEVAPATETASIAWSPVSGHTGTVEDALQVAALEPDLVVVDGYQFDASFYVELGDRGCRYAVIDDNGETSARDPVLVLNQNPHAAASTYAHLPSSRLLLGLEFALLRRAIRDIEAEGGGAEHRARVLVSIGGSDPLGLTVPVVTELAHLDVDLRVAIGPSNPCGDEIRKSVQDLKCAVAIDPATYVAELAGCDLAVIGAGSTSWEAAYLGVPTVGLVVADNQRAPSAAADLAGFTQTLDGRAAQPGTMTQAAVLKLIADPSKLAAMSAAGRRSVDGRGVQRVGTALTEAVTEGSRHG